MKPVTPVCISGSSDYSIVGRRHGQSEGGTTESKKTGGGKQQHWRLAEEDMRVFDAYLGLYLPPYLPTRGA
ncbi:hypothetical protein D3C80_1727250 [compost metagenome]